MAPRADGRDPSSGPQLLNKGTEHYSYPCTPTTMLPRSAYWHHITGSQNIAEASSYTGESLQCLRPPAVRLWETGLLGKGLSPWTGVLSLPLCPQVRGVAQPRPAQKRTSSTDSSC